MISLGRRIAKLRAELGWTQQELADRMLSMATHPMRLEVDPSLLRPVEVPVLRGDATKLRDATGWEPAIPIEETLADLLDGQRARVAAG